MVNDTIVNARNFSDRLCNEVILFSNDFARDLGVTYGQLWAGITIFVVFMIVFYNVTLLFSLYSPKLKKAIKYTYWTIHGLIVLFFFFIFLMIGVAARADNELGRPFIGTKEIIIK
jgi:dolichyl-phosphate-mannose--protein O-mannosyl transferase